MEEIAKSNLNTTIFLGVPRPLPHISVRTGRQLRSAAHHEEDSVTFEPEAL